MLWELYHDAQYKHVLVFEKDGRSLFSSSACGFALLGLLKPLCSLLHVIPALMLH